MSKNKSGDKPPECPVGESKCEWLAEIEKLRAQVRELSDLVATDALTGLFNFRHFKGVLQTELDRSKRSSTPTSLVLADIDHFKSINTDHGLEAGNLVLKQVADICRSEVRTTDVVCRFGGEIFAIIFPDTHLNLAVKVADRIREEIATTPVVLYGSWIACSRKNCWLPRVSRSRDKPTAKKAKLLEGACLVATYRCVEFLETAATPRLQHRHCP